jgi:hypothetical protein
MGLGLGSRQKLCEDCKKLTKRAGVDFCEKKNRPMDYNHNSCLYYFPKKILKSTLIIEFKLYKPSKISNFLKDIKNLKNSLQQRYPVTQKSLPSKKGKKGYHQQKLTIVYPNAQIGKKLIQKLNWIEHRYPGKLKIKIKHNKTPPISKRK